MIENERERKKCLGKNSSKMKYISIWTRKKEMAVRLIQKADLNEMKRSTVMALTPDQDMGCATRKQ